ncbi:predicted protein [Plenodomus lingam JN3]|uniref:Predicted protein n=1 Tax=Leptosphaeria maculans (strain JN3 / isolate v23.1.3 / race Av1-4-5-6-7-8) TaxID=985895 RepID=E5R5B1_LEPMJ|nr:predicted protein [Plenodomus lingam JN3]CBX92081.1 predicted protein [Plenodomus lingam JN3]
MYMETVDVPTAWQIDVRIRLATEPTNNTINAFEIYIIAPKIRRSRL